MWLDGNIRSRKSFVLFLFFFKMSYAKSDVYVRGDDTGVRKILMVRMMSKSQNLMRNLSVVTWKILIDHCVPMSHAIRTTMDTLEFHV